MDSLGINITNLAINVILFGLFYAVVDKLVLKKLYKVLDQRRFVLEQGVQNTNTSKELIESAKREIEDMKKKAKIESEHVIREGRRISEIEGKKIIAEANAESSQIREKANASLHLQRQKLDAEFNTRVEAAVKISLEKIIRESKNLEI